MCCLFTALVLLGPRAAVALWWLFDMQRFSQVYNTFLIPFLGFLFLPFTTLMWTLVWQPVGGIVGFNWVWVGLAFALDIAAHSGGLYGNRKNIPGMSAA